MPLPDADLNFIVTALHTPPVAPEMIEFRIILLKQLNDRISEIKGRYRPEMQKCLMDRAQDEFEESFENLLAWGLSTGRYG